MLRIMSVQIRPLLLKDSDDALKISEYDKNAVLSVACRGWRVYIDVP